jgi:hypothetical protein
MFVVVNLENVRATRQYMVWIQETRLSITGLLPISHAFGKVFPMMV